MMLYSLIETHWHMKWTYQFDLQGQMYAEQGVSNKQYANIRECQLDCISSHSSMQYLVYIYTFIVIALKKTYEN